jgi:hypothetical protein
MATLPSLIYAHKVGVLNEKRCSETVDDDWAYHYSLQFLCDGYFPKEDVVPNYHKYDLLNNGSAIHTHLMTDEFSGVEVNLTKEDLFERFKSFIRRQLLRKFTSEKMISFTDGILFKASLGAKYVNENDVNCMEFPDETSAYDEGKLDLADPLETQDPDDMYVTVTPIETFMKTNGEPNTVTSSNAQIYKCKRMNEVLTYINTHLFGGKHNLTPGLLECFLPKPYNGGNRRNKKTRKRKGKGNPTKKYRTRR